MSTTLIVAIFCMTMALALFRVDVWGERFAGKLRNKHLAVFWLGWVVDTIVRF